MKEEDIKIGQKVRVVIKNLIDGKGINDVFLADYKIKYNGTIQEIETVDFENGYVYFVGVDSRFDIDWLDPVLGEKTWDNLVVGDVLINTISEKKRTVLGICDEIIHLSSDLDEQAYGLTTTRERVRIGRKIKQPTTTLQLTKKQIAEKFGVDCVEVVE